MTVFALAAAFCPAALDGEVEPLTEGSSRSVFRSGGFPFRGDDVEREKKRESCMLIAWPSLMQ